jgi:hypothetical protein
MARPNIKFRIIDESFVVPATEELSTTVGAVYNPTDWLKILGTTAEKSTGYYYVSDISNWYSRLSDYIIKLAGGIDQIAGITQYTVGSCAASYLNGAYSGSGISAGFSFEWWPVHNFLQYGAGCWVGFGTSGVTAGFLNLDFDVIFQGGTGGSAVGNYGTRVTDVVETRASGDRPVIGVVSVPSKTGTITAGEQTGTVSGTNSYNYVRVYGEKVHLDTTGSVTIETQLAPDVAGCIARTDRDYFPWFSPAGAKRGRILNVLRLKRTLTEAEQDALYTDTTRVNPVVTFPGDGTLLFGDKTGSSDTSTLSRINVSRLFMYIKKALAPVARAVLFEQNDSSTRSRFKIAAEGFLDRIVGQRGISEYKVICDESNNTPELIEANYFVADILIKPVTSVNYVTITLTNKDLSSTL